MKDILGSWGCHNLSEAETFLSQVLGKASLNKECFQKVNYQYNDCFGVIAGWNFTGNSPINSEEVISNQDFCRVSLSAGGIQTLPDAVVKFKNESLILSRDCFGRVPLYWFGQQQVIWFASSLQFLLHVLNSPQLSIPGFYGYNCFSYVPLPLSPVENIFSVPAGCEVIWEINQHQNPKKKLKKKQIYKIKNYYQWK